MKKFKCLRCGFCCSLGSPALTQRDIERLKKNLGAERTMAVLEIRSEEEGKTIYGIKTTRGGCVFLKRDKNYFYCEIHKFKPSLCRSFPFYKENRKIKTMICSGVLP